MGKLTKRQMEKMQDFLICIFTENKEQFIEAYSAGTDSRSKSGHWTYDVVCTGETFNKAMVSKFRPKKN